MTSLERVDTIVDVRWLNETLTWLFSLWHYPSTEFHSEDGLQEFCRSKRLSMTQTCLAISKSYHASLARGPSREDYCMWLYNYKADEWLVSDGCELIAYGFTVLLTKTQCLPWWHRNTLVISLMQRKSLHLHWVCNLVIILPVIQLGYIGKLRRVKNNFAADFCGEWWSFVIEVISDEYYAWWSVDMVGLTTSEEIVLYGSGADIGCRMHSFKTQMAEVNEMHRSNW